MTRIVFVTQLLDPQSSVLGFVSGWIQALSNRCDVVVVANEVRNYADELGVRVISLGKERGSPRVTRGVRYQSSLLRLYSQFKPDAILAHMCPVYLLQAAPLSKLLGVPLVLWFAHPSRRGSLILAERLADRLLTSLPNSYPGRPRKLHPIGQGIDVGRFLDVPAPTTRGTLKLISLGRTSPAKSYTTILHALRLARDSGTHVHFRIYGGSSTAEERRYREELTSLAQKLELGEAFELHDGVPHRAVGDLLATADVLVNGHDGSADKVVFEAMAAGRLVLTSNVQFRPLLWGARDLLFKSGDADSLSAKIIEVANLSITERVSLGVTLRQKVIQEHSLDGWADRVVKVISDLRKS